MVLDSSAILAVILHEPGWEFIERRITETPLVAAGAPTLVETGIVLCARVGRGGRSLLDEFLRHAQVEVIPFTMEHYGVAVDAFERYGKGRHPAGLNFGDCLTYSVARLAGLPLLFAGKDFVKTDVVSAR